VVIVDDGSTDRSFALAKAAAQVDNRIRLLTNPDKGVATARNHGISNAAGSLIAPLDADDLWHPAKLARQIERMTQCTPQTGVIYCRSIEIDEFDRVIDVGPIEELPEGKVLTKLIEGNFLGNASTPLIRRSFLEASGGYDPGLRDAHAQGTEDWKLYCQLAELCEFAVVPESLVGYRKSESSMSADIARMARSCELLVQWTRQRWPELPGDVWSGQDHLTNKYIATQALVHNQLSLAMRYKLKALAARPRAALQPSTLIFWMRIMARCSGLQRSRDKRVSLRDFWNDPASAYRSLAQSDATALGVADVGH
jgi:glycosyltransferase involved in cell wall biosynthesis